MSSPKDRMAVLAHMARSNIHFFAAYVFGYENAPHHRLWQRLVDEHDRLVLHAPVEHGKSEQMAIIRVLYEIGRNPGIRVAIVSATAEAQAQKFLQVIRRTIESEPRYHEVFPHVKPETPWGKDAITVRRNQVQKDYTVQAIGVFGPINGSRLDLIILDDILSFDNTWKDGQRRKTLAWIESEVLTRIMDGGKFIFIGTAWHPQDAMFELAKRSEFYHHLDRAIDHEGNLLWSRPYPEAPFGWTKERIEKKRREMGKGAFSRQLLNQPLADDLSRCNSEWFDQCVRPELRLGEMPVGEWPGMYECVTGVDLGVGPGRDHDETCIFTIVHNKFARTFRVVAIEAGHWRGPEILARLERTYEQWKSRIFVESNAAQEYIVHFLQQKRWDIEVYSHTTGMNKYDECIGVERLFVEFERKEWLIPGPEEFDQVRLWRNECLYYHPDSHAGDRLMASWIARRGAELIGSWNLGGGCFA